MLKYIAVALGLSSVALTSFASKTIGGENRNYGIENMIRYSVNANVATIYFPYNYLDDGHPAKLAAVEESRLFFEEQFLEWAKFMYHFMRLEDEKLDAALNSKSAEQARKYIANSGDSLEVPNMMDLRRLATQMIKENTNDVVGGLEQKTVNKMTQELQTEFRTGLALMLDNAIEHSKAVEDNLKMFPKDIDSDNVDPIWKTIPDQLVKMVTPDVFMVQVHGNALFNFLNKDLGDKFERKRQGLRNDIDEKRKSDIDELKKSKKDTSVERGSRYQKFVKTLRINPLTAGIMKGLTGAMELHRYRVVFLLRPWVKYKINLLNGEPINTKSGNPFTYEYEYAVNILANMNLIDGYRIHDTKSLRLSVGGINGNFKHLSEFNSVMSGASINLGNRVNLKAGIVSPLVFSSDAVDFSQLIDGGQGWGYYFLVGAQRSVKLLPIKSKDPIGDDPFIPGPGSSDPVFGNSTANASSATPAAGSKVGASSPKTVVKSRKLGSGFDIAVIFNLASAVETMGADFSGLHSELMNMIGIEDTYDYPYPFFPPGDSDPGLPGGGGPGIFQPGGGSGPSIFLEGTKWMEENGIQSDRDFRRYLIYRSAGCVENCEEKFSYQN